MIGCKEVDVIKEKICFGTTLNPINISPKLYCIALIGRTTGVTLIYELYRKTLLIKIKLDKIEEI